MPEDSISARFVRLETRIDQHEDLIVRIGDGVEQTRIIGERLANHLDDSRRITAILETQDQRIRTLERSSDEICRFCTVARKAVWLIASGGIIVIWWLLQKWLEKHL